MKVIQESELLRIVTDMRNLRYYYAHQSDTELKDLAIQEDENQDLHITARIFSAGYNNTVQMTVDREGTVKHHSCTCSWDSEKSGCGHAAYLIHFLSNMEMPQELPYHFSEEDWKNAERLKENSFRIRMQEQREAISHQRLWDLEKQMQTVHFTLEEPQSVHLKAYAEEAGRSRYAEPEIALTFQIGRSRFYHIKSLPEFRSAFSEGTRLKYGKQFSVQAEESSFAPDSLELLHFILNQEEQPGIYGQRLSSRNAVYIQPENIDECCRVFSQHPAEGLILDTDDTKIKVLFSAAGDMQYRYIIQSDRYMISRTALYLIRENRISRHAVSDDPEAFRVLSCMIYADSNEFEYSDAKKLCSLLMKYSRYFSVSGIQPETEENEKEINVFFDVQDDQRIFCLIQYVYETGNRYGFDPENQNLSPSARQLEEFIQENAMEIDPESHKAYFSLNNENTYAMVERGIPQIQSIATVFASDSVNTVGKNRKYHITVGVSVRNNLLQMDVVSPDLPMDEIVDILKDYRKKKKFHKLKNGETISLSSDDLQELNEIMETTDVRPEDLKDGKASAAQYRAFEFRSDQDFTNMDIQRSDSFLDLIHRFETADVKDAILPEEYKTVFRDYQRFGFRWLHLLRAYGLGGILADDMGLGKTIQVLALLESVKQKDSISIVVCPSSLILNWKDEAEKFHSPLKIQCVLGTQNQRKSLIEQRDGLDLFVTSYDYMRNDIELYEKIDFDYAVLDEAQYIKNQSTLNARSVKKLKAQHRLALTGTPIENSIAELWSIFDFVMPGYLYNYHYFKSCYETPIVKDQDESTQKKLKSMVEPFILRRCKKDVLKDLPDKIEQTLSFEFTEEERKLYLANLASVNKELQSLLKTKSVDKFAVLAMLTRLRQICCDARLVYDNITVPSSKMEGCLDVIENMIQNGRKVIVFSSFTSILSLLEEQLKKKKISWCKLIGETDKLERRRLVESFQTDDTQVFLISLKAGGTGLNITAASCVIHFDPWWNVSAQNQATDRAYRIGQTRDVIVYKLIMKDTIEEKIIKMQERKKNIADTFVENSDGSLASMDTDTLVRLFEPDSEE